MKKVISKDGTPIAYDQTGQGRPVIMVDGALCSRLSGPGVSLAPRLSQHFTVFVYDRRGRNDSGNTLPYAVEREVEDIAALIKEAGGPVCLFGHSSGAVLALEAAAGGLNVEKVAIYEPPYVASGNGPRPPEDAAAQLARLASIGRRGDALEYWMVKMVGQKSEEAASMRNAPFWPALEALAHTLAYEATIMGDWRVPVRMASIRIPALVIDGGASPEYMRQAAQAVAKAIPQAQYRTLEGQTHNVAAEAITPVLIEFFADEKTVVRQAGKKETHQQHIP